MKKDFTPYVEAKKEIIEQIKCNPKLSDEKKNELIASYKEDIARIVRLQTHFSLKDLKRTKQPQFIHL